jgi:hypothetical protein
MSTKNNWGNFTQSHVVATPRFSAFVSYNTPVIIMIDNQVIEVDAKFSSTTSKQITLFKRQLGQDSKKIDRQAFLQLARDLGLNTGRL